MRATPPREGQVAHGNSFQCPGALVSWEGDVDFYVPIGVRDAADPNPQELLFLLAGGCVPDSPDNALRVFVQTRGEKGTIPANWP
jgi:hypothetical protein